MATAQQTEYYFKVKDITLSMGETGAPAQGVELKINGPKMVAWSFYDVIQFMIKNPVSWHNNMSSLFADLRLREPDKCRGVFWEWPRLTPTILKRGIEFKSVLIYTTAFEGIAANPATFIDTGVQQRAGALSVVVPNLTGDARLVIPDLRSGGFGHLSEFIVNATDRAVIEAFWRAVGLCILDQVECNGAAGTWVSTSGLGMPWLHLRVSTLPKYYHNEAYKLEKRNSIKIN